MKNSALFYDTFETPAGKISIAVNDDGAIALSVFGGDEVLRKYLKGREAIRNPSAVAALRKQVEEYFAGSRKPFVFKLAVEYTEFQKKVWDALCKIPHGETRTYGELAKMLGNPKASRAVGRANGSNPVSLFVPCHRVIGADGSLTGYAHGTEVKRKLLELERNALDHAL